MKEINPEISELTNDKKIRIKRARQVTIVGLIFNLSLAAVKIVISILFGSIALLADGLDSALDLATVILGFVALQIADRPPDKEHQFGHEKIEYLFSLGIAFILVASSGIIGYQAITKLIERTSLEFSIPNVIIASASIVVKAILAIINYRIGKKIKSPILVSNSKNFGTDILLSAAVLISVTVSTLSIDGFSLFWIDPMIAIIISILIIITAFSITRESYSVLMDKSPDPEIMKEIGEVAMKVKGVKEISGIRARKIGSNIILADIDVLLEPHLTIMEGHEIVCQVEKKIKKELPVKYLQIHMEPLHEHTEAGEHKNE